MNECQHYKITRLTYSGFPLPDFPLSGQKIEITAPWCSHPNSPVTEKIATTTIGGPDKLTCYGQHATCPIDSNHPA